MNGKGVSAVFEKVDQDRMILKGVVVVNSCGSGKAFQTCLLKTNW